MKHGTLLRTISKHSLRVQCRNCGHEATLKVSELLETYPDARVSDVLKKLKCTKCRTKQIGDCSIVSPDVSEEHQKMRTPAEQR